MVQNDRVRHDECLLDYDHVARCGQPSNLCSDFPLVSRKFISYIYIRCMPVNVFLSELKKWEGDIFSGGHFLSYPLMLKIGGRVPPPIDAHT